MKYYTFLRLGVCFAVLFLPLFLLMICKMRVSRLRNALIIVLFFLTGIATFASWIYPVENHFFSFKSPEGVLSYFQGPSSKINDIIQGESSCFIFYTERHNKVSRANMRNGNYAPHTWYSHCIMEKTAKGFKIPNIFTTKKTRYYGRDDGVYEIYHVENTNDYYLFGYTELIGNKFDYVYGYTNSYDAVESDLKRVRVTVQDDGDLRWEFVE